MTELYLLLKTFHLITIIAWTGSMIVLPWYFILLAKHQANPDKELLLLEIIHMVIKRAINLSMILAYLTGGGLIWVLTQTGGLTQGWLHTKITLALILSACHGVLARSLRRIVRKGDEPKSIRYYTTIAIIIPLCIFGAVFLAVHKPIW